MAGKSYKLIQTFPGVVEAIESFYGEVEELAGEAREVVDNAPESLQESSRIQTFSETADTLENIQLDDIPEALPDFEELVVDCWTPRSKRAPISRAVRLENAVLLGRAAAEAIQGRIEDHTERLDKGDEAASDLPPTTGVRAELRVKAQETRYKLRAQVEAWSEFLDQLNEHLDEAEGVEFPDMFG